MNEERVAWRATGLFAITAMAGVLFEGLRLTAAVVALALFAAGAVMMAAALVIAAGRSRTDAIDIGGLFFSQAPKTLRLAMAAQAVIGLVTATLQASAAFGVLVPIFGLGLCGLWGARHGTYPARET